MNHVCYDKQTRVEPSNLGKSAELARAYKNNADRLSLGSILYLVSPGFRRITSHMIISTHSQPYLVPSSLNRIMVAFLRYSNDTQLLLTVFGNCCECISSTVCSRKKMNFKHVIL